ncbi:MAG: MAPEG family protein [Pseudomonadota bacterium]
MSQLYPIIITILSILLYMFVTFKVGMARGKYKIDAPATTGNQDFERYYRVQMNTLEQLVAFLPSLWIFSILWNHNIIVLFAGVIWIIGRILYARGYYEAANKRTAGFIISLFTTAFLLLGSIVGVIKML